MDNTGDGYDLGDVFLAKTVIGTEGSGTLGDYQNFIGGCAFCAHPGSGAGCGPFNLSIISPSNTNGNIGFRLARSC